MHTQNLTLDEINILIKYFAAQIQLRIQQIHQKRPLLLSLQDSSPTHSSQTQSVLNIIQKYTSHTSDPLQHKLITKFAQRIIQIFQFFKQKTSRHSEGLLNFIENKIKSKLDSMIDKEQIDIPEVLKFSISLTRKGALTNLLKTNHSHTIKKDKILKGNERYLKPCATSIKINALQPHFEQSQKTEKTEISILNHTTTAKLSATKSHLNFEVFNPTQTNKQINSKQKSISFMNRPLSSKPDKCLQRASDSEENILIKGPRKYSLSKKRDSYLKVVFRNECSQKQSKPIIHSRFVFLQKLYVGMEIDKRYLERMTEKQEILTRDMVRRNQRILNSIKRLKRRERTFPAEQYNEQEEGMVHGYGQRPQKFEVELKPLGEKNHTNMVAMAVKGLGKRHSLRMMTYQNNMERKKKMFERQSLTRQTGRVKVLVMDNKQNVDCFDSVIS